MQSLSHSEPLIGLPDSLSSSDFEQIFDEMSPNLLGLISVLSSSSPYVKHLIIKESLWLRGIINTDLSVAVSEILDDCRNSSLSDLATKLRCAKRRFNLLILLADFGNLLSLSEVTEQLAAFAENITKIVIDLLVYHEFKKVDRKCFLTSFKHYPSNLSNAAARAGLITLAMGKLGSSELNYSSDIDLIFLFDEERYRPHDYSKIRKTFINIIRKFVKILSENTDDGFVYRVDLRLRPDPSSNPICMGLLAAQRYYENFGRNWERAAFIKARVIAGDNDTGFIFLKSLVPFIWRKNLDFATIEDINDIRRRIRKENPYSIGSSLLGYDIKTGMGGIREIELFVQTQQLIFGGRNKNLRIPGTVSTLKELIRSRWIKKEHGLKLIECYERLRIFEHILQLREDKQTHSIPKDLSKLHDVAILLGEQNIEKFLDHVSEILQSVHKIVGELSFQLPSHLTYNHEQIQKEIEDNDVLSNYFAKWFGYRALKSERAIRIFDELTPLIVSEMQITEFSASTLFYFDQFLESLSGGVQVLSLFRANPPVLKLLIEICGAAPALAKYLSRSPSVLDHVTEHTFFDILPGYTVLKDDLIKRLEDISNFEEVLDSIRQWVKENQFKTGVHLLKGFSSVGDAAQSFSNIAEVCLELLFSRVLLNFEARYGKISGQGAIILAMGKLGSKEMTLGSDLDLIVIYDAIPDSFSDGKNKIPAQLYFARLTQALISAVTAETSKGFLFKVDMRLRPSGKKGPVATSIKAFENYQINDSRIWERLALSRGRVLNGNNTNLKITVEGIINKALNVQLRKSKVIGEVIDLKEKIDVQDRVKQSLTDPKYGPGRLQDLELLIQMGGLLEKEFKFQSPVKTLRLLGKKGFLSTKETKICLKAHELYFTMLQVLNITVASEQNEDYSQYTRAILKNYIKFTAAKDIQYLLDYYSHLVNKIFRRKLTA